MFSRPRGEFVDIIERPEEARDAWVWRFPRYDNEIKTGALLIVRESETAVLVDEGRVADAFGPGAHTLEAAHLPVLSALRGWRRGSNSPFKAEVYFVASEPGAGAEWAAEEPVTVRDPEFGRVPVRASGVCEVRVADAARLLRESAVPDRCDHPVELVEAVEGWLRERLGAAFAAAVASAGVPVADMAARPDALGERLRGAVARRLGSAGLDLASFTVTGLSLPSELEAAIEERAVKGAIGDSYTESGSADRYRARVPSAAAQWYLGLDGHQVGPFSEEELRGRAASGELTPQTLVWRSGCDEWAAAGEVPELADVLASAPR